jgi:uncharacterized membrane protein YjjP (DUF1212 family)
MNITDSNGQRNHFVKVSYGNLNMEKLNKIDFVLHEVLTNKMDSATALETLNKLGSLPVRYSSFVQILFMALSTASASRVFGGGMAEILVSGIIGLFIGLLIFLTNLFPKINNLVVVISSAFAIWLSGMAAQRFGGFSADIATITGLILLIPGFSFTVSILELVNGHPLAGTARFANTVITLMMIALGILIGSYFIRDVQPEQITFDVLPLPSWSIYIALLTVPLGFMVLFNAEIKDLKWIVLACWCSYFSMKFAEYYFSTFLSVSMASLCLGLFGNIFALLSNRPSSIVLVPGIILLVPGSLGFKSITSLIDNNTVLGIETAFSMTLTAMALVSGLVLSNILVSAKRVL